MRDWSLQVESDLLRCRAQPSRRKLWKALLPPHGWDSNKWQLLLKAYDTGTRRLSTSPPKTTYAISTILTTWNNTYEPKPLAHRSPIYPAHLKSFQRVIRRTISILYPLTKRIKVKQGDLLAHAASSTDPPIRPLPTDRLPKHTLHRSRVTDPTGSI